MKKCCFLVPYFGKLPNYFNLFLKTCSYNQDYEWKIFTDDNVIRDLPKNVEIIKMTFDNFVSKARKKFNFEISLKEPYKLCDFKPAYGYILEEYIPYEKYMFWGHCDLDILIGNLNHFFSNEILDTYDKILCLGHMILYKNNYENNRTFMSRIGELELYKEAFSVERITAFDETYYKGKNVNTIFDYNNKKIFTKDLSLNFQIFPTKFVKVSFDFEKYLFVSEKNSYQYVYTWENGEINRYHIENNELVKEEFLYMHFQSRKMILKEELLKNASTINIIPNYFLPLGFPNVTKENFDKICKKKICFHYLEVHFNRKKKRIIKFFKRERKNVNKGINKKNCKTRKI